MELFYGILAGAIAGGTASTFVFDGRNGPEPHPGMPLHVRLATGTCIGLAMLAFAALLVASLLGVTAMTGGLAGMAAAAPMLVFGARAPRAQLRREIARLVAGRRNIFEGGRARIAGVLAIGAAAAALWRLVTGAMLVRPDGIYTLVRQNYGDLPFHLAVITRFAANQNLPPEHPSFAGTAFTYPFLTDLLSALLVTAGASLETAVVVPALLCMFALIVLIHRWTFELTEDRLAAWLAPAIVLLGGGLGWLLFVRDAAAHAGDLAAFISRLPHDYTIREDRWRWGNLITTLFIPQRGLQLALPLAIMVFRQWWLADRDVQASSDANAAGRSSSSRRMWAAGALAGMLPLVHGHSYLVVVASAVCLTPLMTSWRAWARFFAPALAIGAPQVLWLSTASNIGTSFIGWALGWDRGTQNAIGFWLLNTGAFIPLVICATTLWRANGHRLVSPRLLLFYVPFALCFLAANVVRLAPWVWDNIKVLIYWWIGSAPLVAMLLAHWLRRGRGWRALACAALISVTLSGALDLWRVLSGAAEAQVLNRSAVGFARMAGERTEAGATIVHAPIHNHPMVLSGRRSFMGYPGHLWTHGIDYTAREEEIRRMYAGAPDATTLFDQYAIDYVVIGPDERRVLQVNDPFFSRYEVAATTGDYRLYRIRGRD